MTAKGELLLTAQRFRTQEANRQDARDRLAELIEEAFKLPEKLHEQFESQARPGIHQYQCRY